MAVARDLAKALVQIEKGIEHRFLVPPFGKNIENTRCMSFDIQFTRQGFENAC